MNIIEQEWFWYLYGPANDTSTANDGLHIEPQMIPRLEMIIANGIVKNRKWRGLHELFMSYIFFNFA